MATFRKYEMTPNQWGTAKSKIQVTDEEGNVSWDASKVIAVVELGKLCTEWGTNEEGQPVCVKESSKISVDILWADEPLKTSFTSYEVWCAPMGVHAMGGQKVREEWVETCKTKKPELFPAPVDND